MFKLSLTKLKFFLIERKSPRAVRGIVDVKRWFTTTIFRVAKKAFSEEKALSYAMSYIEDYFDI